MRFFFLALSSPPAGRLCLIPFSSPGTGPDSRSAAIKAGLGFLNVYTSEKNAPSISTPLPPLEPGEFQNQTHEHMLRFITGLGEVQVMLNGVRLVGRQLDGHIEFTPSFLLNAERRLLEDCSKLSHVSLQSENQSTQRALSDRILMAMGFWNRESRRRQDQIQKHQ